MTATDGNDRKDAAMASHVPLEHYIELLADA
jgi:hypothetical protein